MNGYFITLEGGEGAGKTSALYSLGSSLEEKGYSVVLTREPGGIKIAENIRQIILHPAHTEMDAKTEALLYAAARRQHLVEKIIPALHEGKIVLCDRFIDSSLAYQGHARGLGMEEVLQINEFAIDKHMPSLTLYFHVQPKVGLQRIAKSDAREKNRLDLEHLKFHEAVYEGYQLLQEMYPKRIHAVDASQNPEEVYQEALGKILTHIQPNEFHNDNKPSH